MAQATLNGKKSRTKILEFGNANGSTPTPKSSQEGEFINVRDLKRSVAALKRLGVSQADLDAAPQISPLLKKADGGLKQVLAAMRFAPDEVITAFLRKYDSIPLGDRERLIEN